MTGGGESAGSDRRRGRAAVLGALLGIGALSRVLPLLDHGGRLLRQFPTEDGYLMLTIARNIAIGRGMSVAGGSIATNGTQPLATFLYAAGFWLAGGDRKAGVAVALVLDLLLAAAAAFWLYRAGRLVFGDDERGRLRAALAAAIWWAAPVHVRHTMNVLESGLYALAVVAVTVAVLRPVGGAGPGPRLARWAGIGALLGVAFWARNDAVLLCVAVGVAHLGGALPHGRSGLRERLAELAVAAAAVTALAAPWLLYNQIRFGNVMPISGQAESLSAVLGQNISRLPPVLFEYFFMVLPIPAPDESHPLVVVAAAVLVLGLVVALARSAARWTAAERSAGALGALFTLLLCLFYGLFFGAGHFVSRYLFAASPFFALLFAGAAEAAAHRLAPAWRRLAGATLVLLALGLNVRLYALGTEHEHFQVVEWVQEHVPDDTWVGAVQTGTLGFFHDRTINLDGKVNPEALEARRHNRIPAYVAASNIDYIVDWQGIESWVRKPELAPYFEVVVADPVRNLAVLRRHGAPRRETSLDGG